MYTPEKWVPKSVVRDVFLVAIDNLEDLKKLLGATSVRAGHNRNRTVIIEWTMMHRETFSAMVGEYIVRNERGEFVVLDKDDLHRDYEPYFEKTEVGPEVNLNHPELGRLLALHRTDDVIDQVLFELPNGDPVSFVLPVENKEVVGTEPTEETKKAPIPGPSKHNKENN